MSEKNKEDIYKEGYEKGFKMGFEKGVDALAEKLMSEIEQERKANMGLIEKMQEILSMKMPDYSETDSLKNIVTFYRANEETDPALKSEAGEVK